MSTGVGLHPSGSAPASGGVRDALPWAAAGGLAAATGALAAALPAGAAALAGAVVFAGLAVRVPGLLFAGALLILTYAPEDLGPGLGPLAKPELQKGLVLVAVLPLVAARGLDLRAAAPLWAYPVMGVLAVALGSLEPSLTPAQMASGLVTLGLGWLLLATRWRWPDDARLLKVIAVLPLVCLGLGVLLQGAGLHPLVEVGTGPEVGAARLQGASIPAQLALTSFVGAFAAAAAWRMLAWRAGLVLLALDALILLATLSRGALIALAIALVPFAARFVFARTPGRPLRIAAAGAALAAVGFVAIRLLAARSEQGYYVPGQGVQRDATSGRTEAWAEFWDIAIRSPWFGHGLGSGPITKIEQQGFVAQHNEYLRLFLEGGVIGGGLVLAAIVFVVVRAVHLAPPAVRPDLAALCVAMAFLSFTDNTLTSPVFSVPFGLLLGVCAAAGRTRPGLSRRGT